MERSYYYLGGDELHSGMYVALIRQLEQQGLVTNLIARVRVSPNPRTLWKSWKGRHVLGPNPIAELRSQIQGQVIRVPIYPPLPSLSVPFLAPTLRPPGARARRVVLHTRQVVMGRLALALKQRLPEVRVICEMEGDPLAELDYIRQGTPHPSLAKRLRWAMEHRYYTHQEPRLVRESDAVVCVTHKLKELLVRRYGLTGAATDKLFVFPSVGDTSLFHFDPARRDQMRRFLGLEERFVVTYSGNMNSLWQRPDKLVEAFVMIREAREDAYFLIVTPEKDRPNIERYLRQAGVAPHDHSLHTCPHREIAGYLCAADVGLLLRDRHLANQVAAPGKFSEYMLTGLRTILTDGIGDFSEQVRDAEFACVLPGSDRLEEQKGRIQAFCRTVATAEQRVAQGRWAAERFSTDLRIAQLAALYRSL